jgi:hypothetical protein
VAGQPSRGRLGANTVKVAGLGELRKELKRLDEPTILDELKDANFEVAELVRREALDRASSRMEIRAAESLKSARQAQRAQLTGGGAKTPFFGGAEFGSDRGKSRIIAGKTMQSHNRVGWRQFQEWRGNQSDAGYFLYPAIRDLTEPIVNIYGDWLEQITKKAFPDE